MNSVLNDKKLKSRITASNKYGTNSFSYDQFL